MSVAVFGVMTVSVLVAVAAGDTGGGGLFHDDDESLLLAGQGGGTGAGNARASLATHARRVSPITLLKVYFRLNMFSTVLRLYNENTEVLLASTVKNP